ncbi:hypothetical protein NLU13_0669 [Sarocladium strictum]|uniref:Rhodopsin domain-containing protein n=1 Tax=Sarocladium strictum TaxID=5046 RepID=A0AA39GQY2_SARSR|nr:hypothetical protein NLU13_0669 [Sarocladium strictum]
MSLYSAPPRHRDFHVDKPTLLVCWWATAMCTMIILLRVTGRFIRTERLFREDRIAALALIPMYIRMGLVHYILLHATNNNDFTGFNIDAEFLREVSIASGLVLATRIFYAASLWILKYAILEFFERLLGTTWARSYRISLIAVRWTLIATFIAVVISTLAECHPFDHYWQVLPDPGGACRQAFAQLITMATCNVLTDLILVFFPIPIILTSNMTIKRKVQLTLLFSLSLSVVAVTLYRVPHIIEKHGRQQYRSLMASVELMFATAAANALVLGSFMRDRGVKKQKFRRTSAADSFDRTSSHPRRPTLHRHWGSDEDLVRDLGMALDPELREPPAHTNSEPPTPAPPGTPAKSLGDAMRNWQFPQRQHSTAERSDDSLLPHELFGAKGDPLSSQRRVSFFDVGGLLEEANGGSSSTQRGESSGSYTNDTLQDPPSPSTGAPSVAFRRGSTTLLQDLGGFLATSGGKTTRSKSKGQVGTELQTIPQSRLEASYEPTYNSHGKPDPILMDPGGLLK